MVDNQQTWHQIYLGMGSNLGDRRANMVEALQRLKAGGNMRLQAISRLYQTAPVGYADQPDFLNLVVEAETLFTPTDLLRYLKELEVEMGRQPTFRNGPRPIDIDILFYDDITYNDGETLVIPHPRLHERGFVLAPLADLSPNLVHPTLHQSVEEMLDNLIETGRSLPVGVEYYTAEPSLDLPQARLLFVTGRLAEEWLANFVNDLGARLNFAPVVAALEMDVAAFMSARYVATKLQLPAEEWQKIDAVILPGFVGGDLTLVETATKIQTKRGPNDLLEIEGFLAALLGSKQAKTQQDKTNYTEADLRSMQVRLTDDNIRIYSDGERIYAFNRAVFGVALPEERELRRLFRLLNITNAAHAYYLGREFNKACLSIKLGLRYHQDCELDLSQLTVVSEKAATDWPELN